MIWIEAAEDVSLEAEADFLADSSAAFERVVQMIREEDVDIELSADSERALRRTVARTCAEWDEPEDILRALAARVIREKGGPPSRR